MPVRTPLRRLMPILLGISLIFSGCNFGATPAPTQDLNAINTSIVGTTVAQLSSQMTGTALANPTATSAPTNTAATVPTFGIVTAAGPSPTGGIPTISFNATPLPGFTALASPTQAGATAALGDECSNVVFEGDVTIPDGTVLKPGEDFIKIWAIRNTGNCTWDEGFSLVFLAGDSSIDPYDFPFKKPEDFVSPGEGINIGIKLTAPLKPGDYQGHWKMRNDKGYYFGDYLSVYITVKK
ncbi:MAG: hypothetical protein IT314_03825 [Anaerolineales bacterium]|nr:hypothetical protein [Anaerolineales bacterium]